MDVPIVTRDVDIAAQHDLAAVVVQALRPSDERLEERELRRIILAAVRHVNGREHDIAELRLHDAAFHVEVGMAELRLAVGERFAEVERYAGVGAAAVPKDVVIREAAPRGDLSGLGFELLQTDDIGLIALEPVAKLGFARANTVHVPSCDLHDPTILNRDAI